MIGQSCWRRQAAAIAVGLATIVSAKGQESGDVNDPAAAVPSATYESLFPQSTGNVGSGLDAPQFPWRELYRADGAFVPESKLGVTPSSSMVANESMPSKQMTQESMNHSSMSSGKSDARGVVQKIFVKDGKVKLKHGPIDRLEMPGMTMIFYLKDPALIEGIVVGEEVGFNVEIDGSTFYITGFEK